MRPTPKQKRKFWETSVTICYWDNLLSYVNNLVVVFFIKYN